MIDKPVGYGLYLIGPVIERDDGDPYFVMAFGGPRSFTMDRMPGSSVEEVGDGRAYMLRWAQNTPGGAEAFDDQHALLIRAVEVWPNRKTKAALAAFERSMPPAVLVEWTQALQAYVDAREAGAVTEAHRARAREAWAAIRATGGLEPSPDALALMDEIDEAAALIRECPRRPHPAPQRLRLSSPSGRSASCCDR